MKGFVMGVKEFELFLHDRIPITKAMGIAVLEYSNQYVKVSAPLKLNFNHAGTAFGGSINTLMTVCGWAQTHAVIFPHDKDAHVVIQKSEVRYLAPITSDLVAECTFSNDDLKSVHDFYDRRGKAKVYITVKCKEGDKVFAEFDACYVVYK